MCYLRLAAVALFWWPIPTFVTASPVYSLVHNSDAYAHTGPSDSIGPQDTPIDYEFAYQSTYNVDANYGEVHANVNLGSMGIRARTFNNGRYAPQRQEVTANFAFDVIFSSPGTENINVVMNMDLSGVIGVPDFYQTAFVRAGPPSGFSAGTYYRSPTVLNRDGMLSSFTADGTVQTIHTNPINVPVNVPVTMTMVLGTIQAYTTAGLTIDFGSTFSLTHTGNVFDISGPNAEFVTVNSVDANIVDNRYIGVPEPSSLALFGIGAASMFGYVRRRQRAMKLQQPALQR